MTTSSKIPFTYFLNCVNFFSLLTNTSEYVCPANFGMFLAGTIIAQIYPDGIAKKQNISVDLVRKSDNFIHLLPMLMMCYKSKDIKKKHVLFSIILPLIYFGVNLNELKFENPIITLRRTYPGVPLEVHSMYGIGVLLCCYVKRRRIIYI